MTNDLINLNELCEILSIEKSHVYSIIEVEIITPFYDEKIQEQLFDTHMICSIKKAYRLYEHFEIEWPIVSLIYDLMEKNDLLEQDNLRLKNRLLKYISD